MVYVILKPSLINENQRVTSATPVFRFTQLVAYVTPYRQTLLMALLLMLLVSGLSLLSPWLAGQFTLTLLQQQSTVSLSLNMLTLLWLAILAAQALAGFSNQYLLSNVSEQMLANLRMRVYDHLQTLPLSYYQDRQRGTVLTLLTHDADAISGFVTGTLLAILPQLVTLLGAMAMIVWLDPQIALIIGILIPLFYLLMKILGRRLRPLNQELMQQYGKTFAIAEENLNLLPIIKSFNRETLESGRFKQGSERLMSLYRKYYRIQSLIHPAVQFAAASMILLLLWVSSQRLASGQLSSGDLVSLLLYGMLLSRPVSGLADAYGQIQSARGAATRLVELFATEPEPLDSGHPVKLPLQGHICFQQISFGYPGRGRLLATFDLEIQPGETIAITGKNGVGKSTLAHLLMRFISPDKGSIKIDGMNIAEIRLDQLRQQIGLVQQHVLLLNGNIHDNISYGIPGADDDAIKHAAKAAHAMEFIEQLPDGLDTVIGDQGIKLSGGQKQRLALARALLMDAPILILDEATAMFDPEGEKAFIEECHAQLTHRTVIIITHRPASLKLADRIINLDA